MGGRRLPVGNEFREALYPRCNRDHNRRSLSSILKRMHARCGETLMQAGTFEYANIRAI